jgi:hypothetical protein
MRRASAGIQKDSVAHDVAQPEIGDFHVSVLVEENVLGFEVAVADLVCVEVFDAEDDLLENATRVLFVDLEKVNKILLFPDKSY